MIGLENRILMEGELIPSNIEEIDYSSVNLILDKKRQESIEYLKEAMQEAVRG